MDDGVRARGVCVRDAAGVGGGPDRHLEQARRQGVRPTAVAGPTALCAHVRVEGNAQMDPQAGTGEKCNDQTTIGPKNEPIINQNATSAVGDALRNAVGLSSRTEIRWSWAAASSTRSTRAATR